MGFNLSQRSFSRLNGVHPALSDVVNLAIKSTTVDFGVGEGVRSIERQRELVAKGVSKTMLSKHLIQDDGTGHAVDLIAYIGPRVSWELNLYDNIADAVKAAAEEVGVPIRWGAAWHINDIREWDGSMQDAMDSYIDLRRSQGRRPFIDGPHFELRL